MEEGAAAPVTVRVCVGREASIAVIPKDLSEILNQIKATCIESHHQAC